MPRSHLDRRFARFQRDRDPASLADVFDGTAAELLRVARFLTKNVHAAEDLVQTTFLKAIEHKDRYDAAQPVLPWLLGILANTARHERRQAARKLASVAEPRHLGPVDAAEQSEFARHLRDALHGLPEPYREVMLLQIEHGLDNAAVADVTARKPATVRTQIARGMDLLRRALPAGIGGAVAITALPGRGLAAVRAEVLHSLGVEATAVTAVATQLLGTVAMKKFLLLAAIALLLLLSSFWVPALLERDEPRPAPAATTPNAPESLLMADAEQVVGPAATMRESAPAPTPDTDLVVLLRHGDGTAASDIGVYLRGDGLGPFGREGRTDIDGRAAFRDLPAGTLLVKPDRAPATNTTLTPGPNTLEFTLPTGMDVDGRVVDPGRKPVPAARVFALSREHHDHAQYLTTADDGGKFTLRGVAPRTLLFARTAGRQPGDTKRYGSLSGTPGSRFELELRVGAPGFKLMGEVRDLGGAPVPFARVVVAVDEDCRKHPEGMRGRRARERGNGVDRESFLLRCDGAGHFETDEVPEGDTLIVARGPADGSGGLATATMIVSPWSVNRCDLVLRPAPALFGTVRDETGQPFADLPILAEWRGSRELGQFEGGLGHLVGSVVTITAADGSYRLPDLLPGEHLVQLGARLDDHVRIEDPLGQRETITVVGAELQQRDFVVARRAELPLRLLGPNDQPLVNWAIWVGDSERANIRFADLARQHTDAEGRITLHDQPRGVPLQLTAYAPRAPEEDDDPFDRFPARRWADIEAMGEEVLLRLAVDDLPAASLRGRLVDRRGAPVAAPFAQLCRPDWHEARSLAIAEDGLFVCDRLPAGSYYLRRLSAGDPRPGPFELAPGQALDLGDVVLPDPGTLRVKLVCTDGAPIRDGKATLERADHLDGRWWPRRDGDLLVCEPRAPGRYRLFVSGADLAPSMHEVEIRDGEDRTIELRCERGFEQEFTVQLPRGAPPPTPVRGSNEVCEYTIIAPDGPQVHFGKVSSLSFRVPMASGSWTVRIEVPGYERVYQTIEIPPGGTGKPVVVAVR